MPDFTSISYLQSGNVKQKAVFDLLVKYEIFTHLAAFQPVLAGTIPIAIDTPESDLDILCYTPQLPIFKQVLEKEFMHLPYFTIFETVKNGLPTIICRFTLDAFQVEVFGQNKPVTEQQAYRHMLIESRILQEQGNDFRNRIIALKQQGIKTEPAFAQLLGLEGDPYEALLLL